MAAIRVVLLSLLAVIVPLALTSTYLIVSNVPAGLRLFAIRATAEGCERPDKFPENAGVQVVSDLRKPGNGASLSDVPIGTWVDEQVARIGIETDPAHDLVIYIHGFRSTLADAICVGEVLSADLATLPTYATNTGPDIFVFGWPGEFWWWQFTAAQENATHAGIYLGSILNKIPERRIFIVAHSAGAGVAMSAADWLPKHDDTPPLAGILLVEGAIPAVSIREWRSTFTLTHPAADMAELHSGRPGREPFVQIKTGKGSLVAAAAKASHLVATIAGGDIPLSSGFSLDEALQPLDQNRPMIPPEVGDSARNGINVQAIGTPFPTGNVYRRYEELMHDPIEEISIHTSPPELETPDFRPVDPVRVLSRAEWVFEFRVPHPSYHEIRLDRGQWWRLLRDWHGVMNDARMRHDILRESWSVFTEPTE